MNPSCPSVFYCTLLDREADRDDCHRCKLGVVCAGIPSRLMRRRSGDGLGVGGVFLSPPPWFRVLYPARPAAAPQAQGVRDE